MFECTYCNLCFDDKKQLVAHQKTKKCTTHRDIGFICQKCFKSIKGYDNTLIHVNECKEKLSEEGLLQALINQLSLQYNVDLKINNSDEGIIVFKKLNNYSHPNNLTSGIEKPKKIHYFSKFLEKHTIDQIIGCHNLYINDLRHKIFRVSDTFQFLSMKYNFEELFNILWIQTTTPCIYLKDENIYILGKIQCQNSNDQKWFGDTFLLKHNEKINKCIWYQDNQLIQFYSSFKYILRDLLNLYLSLGGWALKQKKIKLKANNDLSINIQKISDIVEEYNFKILINTIQKLNSYETFKVLITNLLQTQGIKLHSNIEHIFKDNASLSPIIDEDLSLMNMNDPELVGGNYYFLMYYILPESERKIFISKE